MAAVNNRPFVSSQSSDTQPPCSLHRRGQPTDRSLLSDVVSHLILLADPPKPPTPLVACATINNTPQRPSIVLSTTLTTVCLQRHRTFTPVALVSGLQPSLSLSAPCHERETSNHRDHGQTSKDLKEWESSRDWQPIRLRKQISSGTL